MPDLFQPCAVMHFVYTHGQTTLIQY